MISLLQSQVNESCKLALPEGLKDLMSDISREVLRAQPQNLYEFIAKYLEALLEVREALSIAYHICDETCGYTCELELQNELRAIGLEAEDLVNAVDIIQEHLKSGSVHETSLFIKLIKKTDIDEFDIPAIQEAIQRAFKRQQLKNTKVKYLQNNHYDETTKAVQHTMNLYENSKPKTEDLFVSTHLNPYVNNVSSTSCAGGQEEISGFKTETTCNFDPSEEPKEKSPQLTNNDFEKEFEKINTVDINSGTSNEKVIDNVSGNDNEMYHPGIENFMEMSEDVNEEIEDGESGNDSIVSSIDESLPISDTSDEII